MSWSQQLAPTNIRHGGIEYMNVCAQIAQTIPTWQPLHIIRSRNKSLGPGLDTTQAKNKVSYMQPPGPGAAASSQRHLNPV